MSSPPQSRSRSKATVTPISLFVSDSVLNKLGSKPSTSSTSPGDASSLAQPTTSKGKSKSYTHDESLLQGQRNANTFKVCHALIHDIRAEEVKKAGKASTRTDLIRTWVDSGKIILDRLVESHASEVQRRVIPTSKDCRSELAGQSVDDRYDEIFARSSGQRIPINVVQNGAELLRLADDLLNPDTYRRFTQMDGFTKQSDEQPFYKDYGDLKSAVSELRETYAQPYKAVTGLDLSAYLEESRRAQGTILPAPTVPGVTDTGDIAKTEATRDASAETTDQAGQVGFIDHAALMAKKVREKATAEGSAGGSGPSSQDSTSATGGRLRRATGKFFRRKQ